MATVQLNDAIRRKIDQNRLGFLTEVGKYLSTTVSNSFKKALKLTPSNIAPEYSDLLKTRQTIEKKFNLEKHIADRMTAASKPGEIPRIRNSERMRHAKFDVEGNEVQVAHISGKRSEPYEFGGTVQVPAHNRPEDWLRIARLNGEAGVAFRNKDGKEYTFLSKNGVKAVKVGDNRLIKAHKTDGSAQMVQRQIKPRPFLGPSLMKLVSSVGGGKKIDALIRKYFI